MKATLAQYRQSPQKVRLVAGAVRGKSVPKAREVLAFLPKKSTPMMRKLLESAVANARSAGKSADELVVKTVTVDKGMTIRRVSPKARGRSAAFRRTRSIITIELGDAPAPKAAKPVKAASGSVRIKKTAKTAKIAKSAKAE